MSHPNYNSPGGSLRTSPPGGDSQWGRAHCHPGYPTRSQYTSNVGYGEPLSQVAVRCVHLSALMLPSLITASSKSFGEQPPYAYQGNQSDAHHGAGAPQNIHDPSIAPGLLWPEYYAPPDHVCACSLFIHSPSDWVRGHRRYQIMPLSVVRLNRLTYWSPFEDFLAQCLVEYPLRKSSDNLQIDTFITLTRASTRFA
jgi:hypothetical protein